MSRNSTVWNDIIVEQRHKSIAEGCEATHMYNYGCGATHK